MIDDKQLLKNLDHAISDLLKSEVSGSSILIFILWLLRSGPIFGVELGYLKECEKAMTTLLATARAQDEALTSDACTKFMEDLLSNPRPSPEVLRGFLGADILRSQGIRPIRFSDSEEQIKEKVRKFSSTIPKLIKALENYGFNQHMRYTLPRYLDGYKDLVEGDYESVLNLTVTLQRIVKRGKVSYEEIKKRRLPSKVKEIANSTCEVLLSGYNRHIRNHIAHATYNMRTETYGIEFKDNQWKQEISILNFMKLLCMVEMVNELAAIIFSPSDPKLSKALSEHWDSDFL